jgi:hypothetical protein
MAGSIVKVNSLLVDILLIKNKTGRVANLLVKCVDQTSLFQVACQNNYPGVV